MQKDKYVARFFPNHYYHIYNRTNNKEALFHSNENRRYFLRKYAQYLHGYVKTYAYCLLDNHFHMLIQVRSKKEIIETIMGVPKERRTKLQKGLIEYAQELGLNFEKSGNLTDLENRNLTDLENRNLTDLENRNLTDLENLSGLVWEKFTPHEIVTKPFQDFFTAYAKAFNKQQQRQGNLFNRRFKRIFVKDENHFTQLIYYIHNNPCHHSITNTLNAYPWSSYQSLLSEQPTLLERIAVMDWFGDKNEFKVFHGQEIDLNEINDIVIEEPI